MAVGGRRHKKNFINMKRIIITFIAAIAFAAGAMAQDSRVATLQHGSNIRAYYGADAFKSAYNDAADGDVITLSAGEFNFCSISKAITIRGEGVDKTQIGYANTTYSIKIPQGSPHTLCLEGITLDVNRLDLVGNDGSEKAVISKCKTPDISISTCNAIITQSKVRDVGGSNYYYITCLNSVLGRISGNATSTFDVQNCVITGTANVEHSSIKNSIIYGVSTLGGTSTSTHCLLKEGSSGFDNSWYITANAPEPDPWGETPSVIVWDDLFSNDYHLTEEASQTYVGTDGTEVGIYGGIYPFDATPDYPLVKELEVTSTHKDGKLNVQISVE